MSDDPTPPDEVEPSKGSLVSPLLSGRSLEPLQTATRPSWFREHLRLLLVVGLFVALAVGVGAAKIVAEGVADRETAARAHEIESMLEGATTEDFLAFNVGVKRAGSLARAVRDEPGFVNVKAGATRATIRFQPSGWWSGFTERCIVVEVTDVGVVASVPKVSCVRVQVEGP